MKLKKAKKFESSLVVVLEFIRVAAKTNPKATGEILKIMGVNDRIFADCVNRLVGLALKNADAVGECIDDVLSALRKKSAKSTNNKKNADIYADIVPDKQNDEDEEDDSSDE